MLLTFMACILLAQLPPWCFAMLWSRGHSAVSTTPGKIGASAETADTLLSGDEIITMISGQDSLDHYTQRPDCFRRAAGLIRARCEQLDMYEEERVKASAAISMTLCELATAKHHSIPLECVPFSLDSGADGDASISQAQGQCVDALSRSAQFWSSYSGYLREVTQLCFALRRWNDMDMARDLYRNATLEQSTLLRFLVAREKASNATNQALDARLTELQNTVSQMVLTAGNLESSTSQFDSWLQKEFRNSLSTFAAMSLDIQSRQEEHASHLLSQTSAALDKVARQHAYELQMAAFPLLEESLTAHVDTMLMYFHAQVRTSLNITREVEDRWISFGNGLDGLTQSIVRLSATATEVSHIFETSMDQAQALHQKQHLATASASHLVDVLANLTTTTHEEFDKITNASTVLIQQTLLHANSGASSWLVLGLTRMMEVILRVDPQSLEYFNHLPNFGVLVTFLSLMGSFVRVAASSITSSSLLGNTLRGLSVPGLRICLHKRQTFNTLSLALPVKAPPQPTEAAHQILAFAGGSSSRDTARVLAFLVSRNTFIAQIIDLLSSDHALSLTCCIARFLVVTVRLPVVVGDFSLRLMMLSFRVIKPGITET
ncbi:Nuclear fusion protein KAR5 [Hypsizygus marmoreus]|uniref:Nuclear fusion protein KAR5 n=1 Tax=Hypsizygus marmoreus TaxID=39966 RepID=A0A369J6N8_HYPMA|nr:Nuclear fusion protein KAR5 [Hypsizygus marmoreus]